jgi:hypothetical protein
MQQLKQHNLGMRLRLTEQEFLVAQGPALPHRGTVRRIRMRVEPNGFAERSYHELAPQHSVYTWCSVQLDAEPLAALTQALHAARDAQESVGSDDPDAIYRTLEFWNGGRPVRLCIEYVGAVATPAAPAFEAAWRLLETQFAVADVSAESGAAADRPGD